jgi:3-dehydroquinate synthase
MQQLIHGRTNMSKQNIVLTGFMGTGKTTVGKLLAAQLGYDFVDTDDLIVSRIGQSISGFFKEQGEAAFRRMEASVAQELAEREGLVISTGGRMMLDPNNAALLGRRGRVFCLVATPEEIMERVASSKNVRPLLQVPNPLEHIVELMQQREKSYGQFTQLVTSEKMPGDVTNDLVRIIQGKQDLRLPITASATRYEFIVGGGILPFVKQLADINGPVAVITDQSVEPLYAQSCGHVDVIIAVPAGRQHKTLATAQSVFVQLLDSGFDRSGTIIALGGTVISEFAGFVAATYMRGVDCVQCPTSLLAMVDTSIGGKTGLDLPRGKNIIGAFKQPKAVIADVATLQSLPPRAFASGMAEVIKHSLIADTDLFNKIEAGNWKRESDAIPLPLSDLQTLVAQAIQVKINIIQEDPFEQGRRTVLNLGHTFAHAIEQVSDFTVRHGEAVAMGLVAAANLSARMGFCSSALQERIESALAGAALPTRVPGNVSPELLLAAMSRDKKRTAGRLRFVLMRGIGDVFVTDAVDQTEVLASLKELSS